MRDRYAVEPVRFAAAGRVAPCVHITPGPVQIGVIGDEDTRLTQAAIAARRLFAVLVMNKTSGGRRKGAGVNVQVGTGCSATGPRLS